MPPQRFIAKLEDKTIQSTKFTQFKFELVEPYRLDFLAGQYVSFKVSESGDRRSYSICSSPDIKHGFELLVEILPDGLGSQYLNTLPFGSQVEILAPMGMFTLEKAPVATEYIFVATGSGVAPYFSMLQELLQVQHDTRPITLYWGLRYGEEMCWQDEFSLLAEAFENFTFHPVLSRPGEGWPLCSGRVTDCLSVHHISTEADFFLCGNKTMIADMTELLSQKGVVKTHIHTEQFN
ncbi:MAG: hypothetical protein H6774_00380 [Pseudomonadales bacterium]|nr:hypothetical protein [Candidatus Woesebacteria bacterium]MCB9801528.1 hypothetical protein [Pseudomonadales bacterium]